MENNNNKEEVQQNEQQQEQKQEAKPILIVDANAFIKNQDLLSLSQEYEIVSSLNVINEVKDSRSKSKLGTLPFDIINGQASEKSMKFVKDFALATGDFASLSFNDMEIIAIAYEYCQKQGKLDKLRNKPPKAINAHILKAQREEAKQKRIQAEKDGQEQEKQENEDQEENEYSDEGEDQQEEENSEEEEEQEDEQQNENQSNSDNEQQQQQQQQEEDDEEEDEWQVAKSKKPEQQKKLQGWDDNSGWINQENLHKFLKKSKQDTRDREIGIFVMTADYAMQNVIIQIGIPLLSLDNMVIRQAKRFVLECFACKELCFDNSKEFCPACKNHSLLKVSCSANSDGTFVLYRKKGHVVNQRGFIYAIPKYKGGRNNKDLILREDQLLSGELKYKAQEQKRMEQKAYKRAMLELEAGFSFGERTHKYKGQQKIQFGYGKSNPNDKYHIKNKRNKK